MRLGLARTRYSRSKSNPLKIECGSASDRIPFGESKAATGLINF
jgi:hypothetical protein